MMELPLKCVLKCESCNVVYFLNAQDKTAVKIAGNL